MKKENEGLKKPFFATFLENQISENDSQQVAGGVSKKYPSDAEDDITKPALDILHTQKYPSDGDEV